MREFCLICILVLVAKLAEDAYGSTLCSPHHRRRLAPSPLSSPSSLSSPTPVSTALTPTWTPPPPALLMEINSPPTESPEASPSGGGWSKAKTGGVAAGGSVAVVGALLWISRVASFSFLDANTYRRVKETAKRFLRAVLVREVLAKQNDGGGSLTRYPVFEGEDAKKFIQQYERFARNHKMHGNLLSHVEVYLDPTTRNWYRSKLASRQIPDWKAFIEEFEKEFGRVEETYEQVMEELEEFQQGVDESVDGYVRRSLEFVSRLDRVNPCQQQQGQLSNNDKYVQLRFLAGLRPNVREKVKAGVKGVKSVSWDLLQAVAKAVSFEAAELGTQALDVLKPNKQALGELKAVRLETAIVEDANKVKEQALSVTASKNLKAEKVSSDVPKIEEVSLDVAEKVEAQQGTAVVQSTPVKTMPPTSTTEIGRASSNSTFALLQSQILQVQQQHQHQQPQLVDSRRWRGTINVVCYNCGERGHYRSQCPRRAGQGIPEAQPR